MAEGHSSAGIAEDYLHRPYFVFPNKRRRRHSTTDAPQQPWCEAEDEACLALTSRLPQYSCYIRQVPSAATLFTTQLRMNPHELHKVRPHQRDAVAALVEPTTECFLSGCVVLPCGSGKTLVGVLAATVMRRSTLVVCATLEQVEQWERQVLRWTLLPRELVFRCGSAARPENGLQEAAVVLATYHWLSGSREAEGANARVRRAVFAKTYGLLLMDEVHKLPATAYRHIPRRIRSSWRVGLTADMSREAEEEHVILSSVGPVRSRVSVARLVVLRVIARVQLVQVLAPLPRGFSRVVQDTPGRRDLHRLLILLNPYKFCYLRSLIHFVEHKQRQKLLVMFEEVLHLQVFAVACRRPWACGKNEGRETTVQDFQHSTAPCTLLVSRISDTGLDVPDLAYCLQLDGLGGSRQQEVQRVGRVQRYKPDGRISEFHTMVTKCPKCPELGYSQHRNAHLQEQGYSLRQVPPQAVLRPILAPLNARLANFARQLDHKLSTEVRDEVNKWILEEYPALLRALPFQEL
ncbi:TFIIH basal transcription factor complex helicase repB subunit [Portunus trituberculatus]|uniref:DNA 3'-5' helicase n=1 Tax=Portunus trituberculatus TaxID=210409 RepID=A0A5B7ENN1_PORTR|nr:TFIIH basal transcription factor complex helicase repB subunit [Portunus trituberculatus]